MINRTIYMYWEQGFEVAPDIVKKCRDSWINMNPGWQVMCLDKHDIPPGLIGELKQEVFEDLPVQMRSDLIRLKLLNDNGGVWADATSLCVASLDSWVHDAAKSGIFMFSRPGKDREIANWFIAAERDNYIISKLYQAQCKFWSEFEFEHECDKFHKRRRLLSRVLHRNRYFPLFWFLPIITKGLKVYPYFVFHYSFFHLILSDRRFRSCWKEVPKIPARNALLPQRLGLLEKTCLAGVEELAQLASPVYKLNHRVELNESLAGTYLEKVFSMADIKS